VTVHSQPVEFVIKCRAAPSLISAVTGGLRSTVLCLSALYAFTCMCVRACVAMQSTSRRQSSNIDNLQLAYHGFQHSTLSDEAKFYFSKENNYGCSNRARRFAIYHSPDCFRSKLKKRFIVCALYNHTNSLCLAVQNGF
jgi:hypothetical protein